MLSLPDIAAAAGGEITGGGDDATITGLSMRTSDVAKGSLFCCVRGSTADGHDHAAKAIKAGAAALLVDNRLDVKVPQIVVEDVRQAIGPIAAAWNGYPTSRLAVYGITGTNGKTTTSHLLASILRAAGRQPGIIGTVGATVGGVDRDLSFTTPEAIELQALFAEMVNAGDQSCAMEVSSHALEQGRVRGTTFAVAGFTNLTRDHLDYHRSFEAYYVAKRRLFAEPIDAAGTIVPAAINCDDEWGARLFDELVHSEREDVPVWGYTIHGRPKASVLGRYRLETNGSVVHVSSPSGDLTVETKLRGRFNVENVLCAVTMALLGGIDDDAIVAGVAACEGVRGRFEPIEAGQDFQVIVDYAHTPDSLEQVLESARDITDGRVIVVFGCGGDRDRTKRPRMGRAAGALADVVIVTSDNPRSEKPAAIIADISRGTRTAKGEVIVEPDRAAAIRMAIEQAEKGDVVVIAGKGHEQGQIIGTKVVPFDDASVARDVLASVTV